MEIRHHNIVYIRDFSEIGGVETFTYELVKKYHNLDIAVVYKTANPKQLERVAKYCKTYQHVDQKIICDVAIINYDITIIKYIDEKAKIYQVVHGDYENSAYQWAPPTHDRITEYIAVTKHIEESFKRITGTNNVWQSYNPLTIEDKPFLTLVSATRLSKIKGVERMRKLSETLDARGINYIWYVFTNSFDMLNKPNIIFMKNRLDVYKWISKADYLVQLSDTEACSYSINEALYRNVPVIVTPLPYLEEIGVKDGINAYIMNFDCSNIDYIVDNIENKPVFKFKKLEDKYKNILVKSKSKFMEEKKVEEKLVKVRALATYKANGINDSTLNRIPETGEVFEVPESRAKILLGENKYNLKFVELVEQIETAKKEIEKETAAKKPTKAKKNAKK